MSQKTDESSSDPAVVSFVVRFTQTADTTVRGAPRVEWRGRIRHIQTNEETGFIHFPDAMTFMARFLDGYRGRAAREEQPMSSSNPMREGFRLWEQMTRQYIDTVMTTVERSAESSAVFQRQVERTVREALGAWQPGATPAPEADAILSRLDRIEAHLAELGRKIDELLEERDTE